VKRVRTIGVHSLLILSVILTVISAGITYLNVLQKKEATGLVIHHYKVIQSSTRLLSLMKDMEIGLRGYLITSDSAFLQPYEEAHMEIDQDIDTLTALVKDNPRQLEILQQRLLPLVQMKKRNLEESFRLLRTVGRDSATHFAAMRVSKARLDSIRYWSADFIAFEQTLLNERNEALEQRYFINDVIRFSSFTLIGITSLAALFTIFGKERDNARLLEELQKFNLQLELKVKERTHELLAANRDLIQLNEEKNNFLAITTHDLKAPLAGITSLLNVMKLDAHSLTEKHRSYIQLMEETCENMQRLISDLLDLSRIEQGTINIQYQEIQVAHLFSQLEERFRSWAGRKNIKLHLNAADPNAVISADPDLLLRILDNLLSNALKFSPFNKTVTVSHQNTGNATQFVIQDEGPGFKPTDRELLFHKFKKLSAKPTDGESSSGLGLSIVKDLVDLMHGTIEVSGETNKGARFTVTLPVA
jgi:signal transduction histidine kinase